MTLRASSIDDLLIIIWRCDPEPSCYSFLLILSDFQIRLLEIFCSCNDDNLHGKGIYYCMRAMALSVGLTSVIVYGFRPQITNL